jgi:dUTP pyrophosphatase
MNNPIKVKIVTKFLYDNMALPEYKTIGAAGFDFQANILEPILLYSHTQVIIPTGIFVEIPEGYELQLRSRSGLTAKHGVVVKNSPATIDSDYRGEIKIILGNTLSQPVQISPGDRIAQGVLNKVYKLEWEVVESLSETERGEGGLGSTGK